MWFASNMQLNTHSSNFESFQRSKKMSCPDCLRGTKNTSETVTGKFYNIHGLRVYVAEPPDCDPDAIIIILPDGMGVNLPNNFILSDHYAKMGGYKVYLPDFHDGESGPTSAYISTRFI
jgi:hypothetical protein